MYTCALNLENGNGYLALVELPYRHYFKLNFGGWRHIDDSQNIVDQLYKYLELKVVEIGITNIPNYLLQEAMENFVFPDEITTKLMKMSTLMNIFHAP